MAKKKNKAKKKDKNGLSNKDMQKFAMMMNGAQTPNRQGLFAGLSRLLPSGRTEQFLVGAAVGAVAAYILSDEQIRARMIRSGMQLYSGLAGGLAEIKEQMADIQAEMAATQDSAFAVDGLE